MNYLGIDIGGTNLKAGIIDQAGNTIVKNSIATPTNFVDFAAALRRLVGELVNTEKNIAGVGIGCKGIIHPVTTEVEICPGEFQFLEKHRLNSLISDFFPAGVRIVADNDARAALVGEKIFGAANGVRNALMLTLGTGIGGAILAEGKILRGKSGVAGHLGHITIDPRGKMCFCGNTGCLETVFSARAIEAAVTDSLLRGCKSILSVKLDESFEGITCLDVFEAANQGDAVAQYILNEAVFALGAGIAGFVHVFDPEVLIIGGNIAQARESLFNPLSEQIYQRTRSWIPQAVPIITPQIGTTDGIIGAASLAIDNFLDESLTIDI